MVKKLLTLLILSNIYAAAHSQTSDLLPEGTFTKGMEGPACDKRNNLYAVNFGTDGTIGKINFNGKYALFATLPEGSVGNGIRFDSKGNMYIADYKGHNLLCIPRGEKTATVFAHFPEWNQPNDLAISSKSGIIYLSDPNWADSTGKIWMVSPTDAKITLLEDNMGTTNGIEVSPDGKRLYVNESVQRVVWVYTINEDGTLSNKRQYISFRDYGLDGMRCDKFGNLFITRYDKGTVAIVSTGGSLLKEIKLTGKQPTNLTFNGSNTACYVTMADRGCFEMFAIDTIFE